MNAEQIVVYTAGIFDGEGTVGIYRVKNGRKTASGKKCYWQIKLAIAGTYRPMIEKLQQFFEYGSLTKQKRQAIQRTPNKNYDPKLCKQCWRWTVDNKKDIKHFLLQIRPFLMEKADQVDIVLKFIDKELEGSKASRLCKEAKNFVFRDGQEIFAEANFKGSANPSAKLNEDKVRKIKERALKGERQVDLAREYKISKAIICSILRGRSWKHVKVAGLENLSRVIPRGNTKLTEDSVREIRARKSQGEKQSFLAKEFGVSDTAISEVVNRKKWVHI